jgi:hypothetical protein
MTSRIALAAIVAALLFGVGYAIAEPAPAPRGGGATDAAPQALELDAVDVDAGLTAGTPATLRPAPTPRPRRPSSRARARPSPPAARTAPRAVATPRPSTPRPSTPAPAATSAPAPRPTAAPNPRPAPTAPPDYVGSGFDDSG